MVSPSIPASLMGSLRHYAFLQPAGSMEKSPYVETDPHILDAVVSYTLAVLIAAMDRILAVMGWDAVTWDTLKSTLAEHFAAP